jgi:hypothetical protein
VNFFGITCKLIWRREKIKRKKKQTRAKPDGITMHTSFREVGPAWMNQKILRKTIFLSL